MPTEQTAADDTGGPVRPTAPAGEYTCSDGACRRRWTHEGGPLPHIPVLDQVSATPGLRWHPCPDCQRTTPALADLAHRLRLRIADDLRPWGPVPGAEADTDTGRTRPSSGHRHDAGRIMPVPTT